VNSQRSPDGRSVIRNDEGRASRNAHARGGEKDTSWMKNYGKA